MEKLTRRTFLSIAANSSAFAAAEIGSKKINKLIPYVTTPDEFHPGNWLFYNTTCRECPAGCGMFLRHINGRVVKAEGNPHHPINQGGLCPRGQASVQGLYDPDRLKNIVSKDYEDVTWPSVLDQITKILQTAKGKVLLVSNIQTGSMDDVFKQFISAFGDKGKLIYWQPFNYQPQRLAYQKLFNIDGLPHLHLDQSDLIISFATDFLEGWISNVQWTKQFSKMHHSANNFGKMIYIGPRYSMTATSADGFIQVDSNEMIAIAIGMLKIIVANGWAKKSDSKLIEIVNALPQMDTGIDQKKLYLLAKEFVNKKSVALACPTGSFSQKTDELAAAAALLNYAAGNFENTIDFSRLHALSKCIKRNDLLNELRSLTNDDVVIFHDCNPVYNLKGCEKFIPQAGKIIYMGTMPDETSRFADIILPVDHYLESWGDYQPWSGVNCLLQPTMKPIYDTQSAGDIIISLTKNLGISYQNQTNTFYDIVKAKWQKLSESSGKHVFIDGGYWTNGFEKADVTLNVSDLKFNVQQSQENKLKLWLWNSVMLYDGAVSNHSWLQENPEPISQIGWGNCAEINPKTAEKLKLKNGDVIIIKNLNTKIKIPVLVTDGICENFVSICFGQGHWIFGRNADSKGSNAFEFSDQTGEFFGQVEIIKTDMHQQLITLVETSDQYNRQILQWQQQDELENNNFKPEEITTPLPSGYKLDRDLYPPHDNKKHRWAMAIDLDKCIGCGACAVACYAENNIPVMGPRAVQNGREMAWLKVVPYRNPVKIHEAGFLPMLCQHCDAAPCEPVCPVFAAVHNEQGLNSQIYNRCIGTRYCSNNCPYKVRRFNWFDVKWDQPLHLQLNPQVTVRCRGVMEKCTFCVQRILSAEFEAKMNGQELKDGTVQPACVQSCPADVFTFGDLMDDNSAIWTKVKNPRRYQILRQLNTKPAIFYLKKVTAKKYDGIDI